MNPKNLPKSLLETLLKAGQNVRESAKQVADRIAQTKWGQKAITAFRWLDSVDLLALLAVILVALLVLPFLMPHLKQASQARREALELAVTIREGDMQPVGSVMDETVRAAFADWLGYNPEGVEFGYPTYGGKWRNIPFYSVWEKDDNGRATGFPIGAIWEGTNGLIYGQNDQSGEVGHYGAASDAFVCDYTNVYTVWPANDTQMLALRLNKGRLYVVTLETNEMKLVAKNVESVLFGRDSEGESVIKLHAFGKPRWGVSTVHEVAEVRLSEIFTDDFRPINCNRYA